MQSGEERPDREPDLIECNSLKPSMTLFLLLHNEDVQWLVEQQVWVEPKQNWIQILNKKTLYLFSTIDIHHHTTTWKNEKSSQVRRQNIGTFLSHALFSVLKELKSVRVAKTQRERNHGICQLTIHDTSHCYCYASVSGLLESSNRTPTQPDFTVY